MNRFCLPVGLLAVSAFAAEPPLASLLKTVEQRYNHADTLQVLFREDYTKTGHARRSESGLLELRKPGRMRWEYSDPKGKLAVCDGKTFWMYTPSENRVERTPLRDTDDMQAPSPSSWVSYTLKRSSGICKGRRRGPAHALPPNPRRTTCLTPPWSSWWPRRAAYATVKVTRFDNSIMEYTFDQEKMNPKLDEKLFQFQVPKRSGGSGGR